MADADAPRNADFVARVVSDPNNPPQTRLLSGWLGDAAEEGYRRLYTNADLSAYVDIPADAILHTEPLRDVQPPGGVLVWVKSDAALKPGGSASSRAARFLQGAVTRDFAAGAGNLDLSSPEKAGYRCVTQVPCGEVTGFTGQCTKQPEVGGAWPCITALPHCAEPTGFTGQCTHQPWPHPTRYVGCTFLHCPTHDLTCIPQICHIVATGLPGCGVVDPGRVGGDPAAKAGLAAAAGEAKEGGGEAAQPATQIPGCGYTQTWGLCPTQLLGCGAFRAAQGPGPVITEPILQCNPSAVDACPTRLGCETQPPTAFCTQVPGACKTDVQSCPETSCGPQCQTQQPGCTQINCTQVGCTQMGPQCPSFGIACTIVPVCAQAFRAAGPGQTAAPGCVQTGNNCLTIPDGDCTFFGGCQQTVATVCTQSGPQCPTQPQAHCTCAGPGCPPTPATVCTQIPQQCPTQPSGDCTFFNCVTQGCAPTLVACPPPVRQPQNLAAAAAVAQPVPTPPVTILQWQCQAPTPATRCFICTNVPQVCGPPVAAKAAAPWPQEPTPATVCFICTNVPQFCGTVAAGLAARAAGPQEPTPATVCFICTNVPQLCGPKEPTPATVCFICTNVPQFCWPPVAQ